MKFLVSLVCFLVCNAAGAASLDELPPNIKASRLSSKDMRGRVIILLANNVGRTTGADYAKEQLLKAGHEVVDVRIFPKDQIVQELKKALRQKDVDVILCLGGTGIGECDETTEALEKVVRKKLPGFGEHLRFLTFEKWRDHQGDIGLLSLDTRADAGVVGNTLIFAFPASLEAVEIALKDIIIPGLPGLMGQLAKKN